MDSPKACAVLVPYLNSIEPETEESLRELNRRGYTLRFLKGCSDIALGRSLLASEALRDGFAETMWIDADMAFDPVDVDKLRNHQLPFTAGLYSRKGVPQFAATFYPRENVTFGAGGGLLAMKYVGFGFVHVRCEVFEQLRDKLKIPLCDGGYNGKTFWPFFLPMRVPGSPNWQYLSEDSAFCHQVRLAGGTNPMADTTIKLGHIGKCVWGWEQFLDQRQIESFSLKVDSK